MGEEDFVILEAVDTKVECQRLSRRLEKIDQYYNQMICLGFNSAKYDCNPIKKYLVKHLNMHVSIQFHRKKITNIPLSATDISNFFIVRST